MPFKKELKDYYENLLKPIVKSLGFECVRSDEDIFPVGIMKKIVENIYSSDVVIADLTFLNPNVFYELGVSHAIGNKTIMLMREDLLKKAPFDINHYPILKYDKDGNNNDFKKRLRQCLRALDQWSSLPTNPIQDFKPKLNDVLSSRLDEKTATIKTKSLSKKDRLFNMVLIAEGTFFIGSDKEKDEFPIHEVWVDSFYMDIYEVRNGEFAEFLEKSGYKPKSEFDIKLLKDNKDYAIVNVTWYDAKAYADWLGKRLPTEAEWEKAARGGLKQQKYPWGNIADSSKANYSSTGSTKIGNYDPNSFGLYDMAGNVCEWCHDWYSPAYYQDSPNKNPMGPQRGVYKVIRGGSWLDDINKLRCSARQCELPIFRHEYLGFRCAKNF